MGWLFTWKDTKEELVARLRAPSRFNANCEILKSSVVGNNHWYLLHDKSAGITLIGLDMMAPGGKSEGWGYKDLSEHCGPVEVNCPLSFLDKASEPTGYAIAWRLKVREFHAKRKAKKRQISAGVVVQYGGECYRLNFPAGPRKGWSVCRVSDGKTFRMSAQQLNQSTVQAAV